MNNILDGNNKHNHLFLASVIAVLCESSPITLDLRDVEKYWSGDISRLQYDLVADTDADTEKKQGSITFRLREE